MLWARAQSWVVNAFAAMGSSHQVLQMTNPDLPPVQKMCRGLACQGRMSAGCWQGAGAEPEMAASQWL